MQTLIQPKLLLIPLCSGLLTWYCHHIDYVLQMRVLAQVAFAGIFFTFAITIGTANRRRFEALDEIAALKSHILSLSGVFAHQHPKERLPLVMDAFRTFFPIARSVLIREERKVDGEDLRQIDDFFAFLLGEIFKIRQDGLSPPEIARLLHWYQGMQYSFERLLSIKEHYTPVILRYYIQTALITAIFFLSPEFAGMGWLGVLASVLATGMILALLTIQDMIEAPFGTGMDNIHFAFIERIQQRLIK
ncbi:MAG: hypothetical protein HQL52_05215 [Magnetococcales bacterium]|nr:hypothetical protein [Magnetococcales bacterium]